MSDVVIRVENLSKKYRINHQTGKQPYSTLREIVANKVLDPWRKLHNPKTTLRNPHSSEDFWALKDVSFDIGQGEVVGIIGRNGAGKSTLLKILSRITDPSKGRIGIRGRVASLLEVGTGFHPELTGRENIYLNGAVLGMLRSEVRRRFDEIVEFAEVEKFLDTPVKRYSSGMYMRLAFAVAAHLEPDILIVDEVLAVGDASFQKKCIGKMRDVSAGSGRTVLFVSHNMGAVRSLCARVCWLRDGRIERLGETGEMVERYLKTSMSSSTTSFLNTEDLPRISGLGDAARITQISLNDSKSVEAGEPFVVNFEIQATRDIEEASVGIGFSMLDGTRLLTLDSDLDGKRFHLKAGTRSNFRARMSSLHLQPAVYMVDLGIRSSDFHQVDYLAAAFTLDVMPGKSTPGFLVNSGSPGVRLPAEWSS